MTWSVVLATGASLKPDPQAIADRVREFETVAVSDAYQLAPWASALVAADAKWWNAHPEAKQFAGTRWSCATVPGVLRVPRTRLIGSGTNSGLLGLDYWVRRGRTKILLLGIDLVGTHYFGPHTRPMLRNTTPARFSVFKDQFRQYAAEMPKGITVINCSMISELMTFPKVPLDDLLAMEPA